PWELKAITHFSESLENRVFYFESFKPDPSPVYNLEWRVDCASLAWSGDIAGLSQRFNECQSELGAKKGNWIELLTERLSLSPEFYIRKHEPLEIYDVHLNGRRIRFSTNLDLLIK